VAAGPAAGAQAAAMPSSIKMTSSSEIFFAMNILLEALFLIIPIGVDHTPIQIICQRRCKRSNGCVTDFFMQ
jgi:hypothetical protein